MTAATTAPRVYWLTTEYFPPETGGTGMIAARLTQGLAERGVDVHVITRQTLPHCAARELVGKVSVRRINPAGRMKGAGWRAFPALLGYIARLALLLCWQSRHYDIVVVSGMKTIPIAAVPVCRLLGKKCVVRVESPFELVEPISAESLVRMSGILGRTMSRALRLMQRAILRRAACVVAISEDIAARLMSFEHPPARVVKIPNSVDLSKFKPLPSNEREQLRNRLGFPAGKTIVVYVGRLSRAKGVLMLIEAWPGLVAMFPNAYLVMVGSGTDSWDDCEAEIVEYVRLHALESGVALVGHSNSVHEYLQGADLFVSPSDYEGFSLTLVEALGCAIPVVTTSVGAAPEIIRDGSNGFLCPPKDKEALRAAVERALGQQHRWPSIGAIARESVQAFDIPRVVEQYEMLLGELSQSPQNAPAQS
jgi:glycosyltransferase involved in cell wall biosynthesis